MRQYSSWPRLLFVEGPEDMHFVVHFAARCGLATYNEREKKGAADGVAVRPFEGGGGVSNLTPLLLEALDDVQTASVGIVLDADSPTDEPDLDRWRSVRGWLANYGYSMPAAPVAEGTIITSPQRPRLGLWLMPDNRTPGMLEHFIESLVPASDPLWPTAVQTVDALPVEDRPFKAAYTQKAKVHTWLAWREWPGVPLGQAVTKRFLDVGGPQADAFAAWLRRLFWPTNAPAAPPP